MSTLFRNKRAQSMQPSAVRHPHRSSHAFAQRLSAMSIATATVLAMSSVAFAQAEGSMMPQLKAHFQSADLNHDGYLTLDEAKAGMPRVAQHFSEIDTARTGRITLPQIDAFIKQQLGD